MVLASILLFVNCGESQIDTTRPEITGNLRVDINNLLPEGSFVADRMDGLNQSPRRAELQLKFQEGIRENYEWFADYLKTASEGEPLPYHTNFGLTEHEYKELQGLMNDIELISTGKYEIEIIKKGSAITFKAEDKLGLLELVEVNLDGNTVIVNKFNLAFSDTVNVTDADNGMRSKWKGEGLCLAI